MSINGEEKHNPQRIVFFTTVFRFILLIIFITPCAGLYHYLLNHLSIQVNWQVVRVGFIPDEIIESVRLRSDIVEVVSRYVQLKKTGKNYTGLCPFHQERTPSFTVAQEKQIFHCFGCGAGGDVFRFLMLKNNMNFYEAVKFLAEQAGVVIPSDASPRQKEAERERESLRRINSLAMDYFHHTLQHHEAAADARQYLAGRGISLEVLELFQVGFAFPSWDNLLGFMGKQGIPPEEVVKAGLSLKKPGGGYYDRFRNRIIFPIWDAAGRVAGFGGRVLDNSLPKYMNTPETPFFSKGRNLYGLHLARTAVRNKGHMIVMEGYLDVITAHLHGITNAVASLGTALTADQGRLLLNYSNNVLIAYDADAAGVAATMRSLDLLQELGCQVSVLSIPDGKDPDDYLQKYGHEGWERLTNKAASLIEYKLRQAISTRSIINVSDKLAVLSQVFPNIFGLKSEVEKEEGLKAIARELNLSWETVAGEYRRFKNNKGKKWTNPDNIVKTKYTISDKEEKMDARGKAETVILQLVLENPEMGKIILERMGQAPFNNSTYQKIFERCLEVNDPSHYQPAEMVKDMEDEEKDLLCYLLAQGIPGDDPVQIMNMYLKSINRFLRQERRENLLKEISTLEHRENDRSLHGLLRELMILKRIEEAERAGDQGKVDLLLQEYGQFGSNNRKYPREGIDSK
jgi:DNA primase